MLRFLILGVAAICSYAYADTPPGDQETRRLLEAVDGAVRSDIERARQEIKKDLEALEAPPAPEIRLDPQQIERERQALAKKVEEWSRSNAILIESIEIRELTEPLSRAEAIGAYYGIDVPKYRKLYELGKKMLRDSTFDIPGQPPPERDENLSRYFRELLTWATITEDNIAQARLNNQRYRMTLYKRATLRYILALLRAAEPLPKCTATALNTRVRFNGRTISTLGCADASLEELKAYVNAIRTLQSAEIDTFAAEAESVLGEQQLVADVLAVVPVVGDAIDMYQLYLNETLTGQCLSPLEKGLTVLFTVIPFFGPNVLEAAVKRSDTVAMAVQKIRGHYDALADGVAGFAGGTFDAFVRLFGGSPEGVRALLDFLNRPIFELSDPDRPGFRDTLRGIANPDLWDELEEQTRITKTLRDAVRGRLAILSAPKEVRDKALEAAKRVMAENLDRLQAGRAAAVRVSNMVDAHADALEKLARSDGEILIFRSVNADAKALLEQYYLTKGMNVKGKSADWGPQRGFIPVDQSMSKIGNPNSKKSVQENLADLEKFQAKVDECLAPGSPCGAFKVPLEQPDGTKVMIVPGPDGKEMPALLGKDGVYRHYETGAALSLGSGARPRPLEVLAAPHPETGKLVPLTADYDFLAIGRKQGAQRPVFDPVKGFVSEVDSKTLDRVNDAVATQGGYEGGNIAHHGAEAWYPDSPGAMSVDDVVTVFDPDQGIISIPRCTVDCMETWCRTNRAACGGLAVCAARSPRPPCIPADPDRLLKDFMHTKNLEGWDLHPNSAWGWGEPNVLGGWNIPRFLGSPFASRVQSLNAAFESAKRALASGAYALVTCGEEAAPR